MLQAVLQNGKGARASFGGDEQNFVVSRTNCSQAIAPEIDRSGVAKSVRSTSNYLAQQNSSGVAFYCALMSTDLDMQEGGTNKLVVPTEVR